jgi:hypothetical protein
VAQGGRNRVRGLSYFLTLWCIGMFFGDSIPSKLGQDIQN